MYASGNDSCPVSSIRKYLAHRNQNSEFLFQRSKVNISQFDEIGYTVSPIGERVLNDMMRKISTEAGLSRVYTNHCVRATTITLLSHAGVETREIMKISGHRNEASVRCYNADSSSLQKRTYSGIIQGQRQLALPSAARSEQQLVAHNPLAQFHNANPTGQSPLAIQSTAVHNQVL